MSLAAPHARACVSVGDDGSSSSIRIPHATPLLYREDMPQLRVLLGEGPDGDEYKLYSRALAGVAVLWVIPAVIFPVLFCLMVANMRGGWCYKPDRSCSTTTRCVRPLVRAVGCLGGAFRSLSKKAFTLALCIAGSVARKFGMHRLVIRVGGTTSRGLLIPAPRHWPLFACLPSHALFAHRSVVVMCFTMMYEMMGAIDDLEEKADCSTCPRKPCVAEGMTHVSTGMRLFVSVAVTAHRVVRRDPGRGRVSLHESQFPRRGHCHRC